MSILLVSISFPVAISAGLSQPAQTVTGTITQTMTSSVLITIFQTTNAYSRVYIVPAKLHPTDCGTYKSYMFNASAGPITGTVTSNSTELNFELASLSDFNIWAPNGVGINCRGPEHPIAAHQAVTSNTFSANLPSSGEYVMTFINTPAGKAAYVNISTNYPAVHPSTVTMTSYVLQTQLQTQTSVQGPVSTLTSVISSATVSTQTTKAQFSMNYAELLTVIALMIVAAAAIIFVISRRRKTPALAHAPAPPSPPTPMGPAATKYCIDCGAQIPARAKHCGKCGAPQA
jgi:hypothetical protein